MISVFRIYLGRSWVANGEAAVLCSLFDQLPEFLHGMLGLPLDTPDPSHLTPAERHAAVRIAMTQAHVVVLQAADCETPNAWTTEEIVTARTGFRHRIPILAILPPGHDGKSRSDVRMADKTVAWNNAEIARGVQELAEAAAAERRVMVERSGRRNISGAHAPDQPADLQACEQLAGRENLARREQEAERPLPTEQIAEAFRLYTAARRDTVARLSRSPHIAAPRSPVRK